MLIVQLKEENNVREEEKEGLKHFHRSHGMSPQQPHDVISIDPFSHSNSAILLLLLSLLLLLLLHIAWEKKKSQPICLYTKGRTQEKGHQVDPLLMISSSSHRLLRHWAGTSRRSGETGIPLDSSWRIKDPQLLFRSATPTKFWIFCGIWISSGRRRCTCKAASTSANLNRPVHVHAHWSKLGEALTPWSAVSELLMKKMADCLRKTHSPVGQFGFIYAKWGILRPRRGESRIRRRRRKRGTKWRAKGRSRTFRCSPYDFSRKW